MAGKAPGVADAPCVWPPLDSAAAFEAYGMRLLDLLEHSLANCSPGRVGRAAFGSDVAKHLLPQAVFAAAAPPGALLYATDVAAFQAGARSLRLTPNTCGGAPPACLMNNSREGSRQGVQRPSLGTLSPRLRARIEHVYAADFELLRRLRANRLWVRPRGGSDSYI